MDKQADIVNLLVKYYKEAKRGICLSNEEDETRVKREDGRTSQNRSIEKLTIIKNVEVKSKTRGGSRCCICFDPFSIQNVSVIVFFCCHAYHMHCLMESTQSVSDKEQWKQAPDYGYDNEEDGEDDETSTSQVRCILCTTAAC